MRGVILISGNGSNLQAMIDQAPTIGLKIAAVISNRADAYGVVRAEKSKIPTVIVNHQNFKIREKFDEALGAVIENYQAEIIIFAGFMRILGDAFIQKYKGKMLNIHPSLLPRFRGLNTHRRALEAGEKTHGATVHFVTEDLDGGPVIAQQSVKISPDDDEKTLADKVLREEHILYPKVVSWFVAGRLKLRGNHAFLDGRKL